MRNTTVKSCRRIHIRNTYSLTATVEIVRQPGKSTMTNAKLSIWTSARVEWSTVSKAWTGLKLTYTVKSVANSHAFQQKEKAALRHLKWINYGHRHNRGSQKPYSGMRRHSPGIRGIWWHTIGNGPSKHRSRHHDTSYAAKITTVEDKVLDRLCSKLGVLRL